MKTLDIIPANKATKLLDVWECVIEEVKECAVRASMTDIYNKESEEEYADFALREFPIDARKTIEPGLIFYYKIIEEVNNGIIYNKHCIEMQRRVLWTEKRIEQLKESALEEFDWIRKIGQSTSS